MRARAEEIAAQIDTSKLGWCIDAMEAYAAECVKEETEKIRTVASDSVLEEDDPLDTAPGWWSRWITRACNRAIGAERERCAKIAEDEPCDCDGGQGSCAAVVGLKIAKAIREQP